MGPERGLRGHEESGQMRKEWDINETYETSARVAEAVSGAIRKPDHGIRNHMSFILHQKAYFEKFVV